MRFQQCIFGAIALVIGLVVSIPASAQGYGWEPGYGWNGGDYDWSDYSDVIDTGYDDYYDSYDNDFGGYFDGQGFLNEDEYDSIDDRFSDLNGYEDYADSDYRDNRRFSGRNDYNSAYGYRGRTGYGSRPGYGNSYLNNWYGWGW